MIRIFTFLLFFALMGETIGQTATKYVFLEHFTNSRCGNCAVRNPAFFTTIANYPDNVHHLAVHPRIPYSSCVLYQANTTDNEARRVFLNVNATPRVFLNGVRTSGSSLITAAALDAAINQKTSLGVQVNATPSGSNLTGTVEIFTTGDAPSGNFKVMIAAAEKLVNYAAPNGEDEHHDVLRDLWEAEGTALTPAATGGSVIIDFDFALSSDWVADQMYVIAWVENVDTKEVLNSGSQFDPPVTTGISSTNDLNAVPFSVLPNPATDNLNLKFDQAVSGTLVVRNMTGQEMLRDVLETGSVSKSLNISNLVKGTYLLTIETQEGTGVQRFIKQ